MFNEKSRNPAVICADSLRRNQSVCKLRFSSDLHKVLLKSNAGVESTYVALNDFETVRAKQCRLGRLHGAARLCCEVEGKAESCEWSNRKNEDTEDSREIIIRDEDDKHSVRCVFACTARFGVRFGTPTSLHAK
jgi:hypothetical protein